VRQRGFFAALPFVGIFAGLGLAAATFSVMQHVLGEQAILAWAWRIPFLSSVVLIGAAVWIRLRLALGANNMLGALCSHFSELFGNRYRYSGVDSRVSWVRCCRVASRRCWGSTWSDCQAARFRSWEFICHVDRRVPVDRNAAARFD